MKRGTIWIDVDGVLLDYTRAFLKYTGLDRLGVQYENLFDYDLTKLFKSAEECHDVMHQFTQSKAFMQLPVIARIQDLEMLKNMGFALKVITMLPTETHYKLNRVKALTTAFGPVFDEIIFTERSQNKLEFIRNRPEWFTGPTYLIEDNPVLLSQVSQFMKQELQLNADPGIVVFGIKHPYNKSARGDAEMVQWVDSFEAAAYNIAMEEING